MSCSTQPSDEYPVMPLVEVLGDTGLVGDDAALPDGGLALGRCLFEPGGDLVTGRSPEPLAGMVAVLLGQKAWS
jgi:hypothetical protein